jgi:ribosomal protein S6E (S10)
MVKGNEGHATQHNGQRKRRTCNTTQWPKETKDMQHNTMVKGNEGHTTQHNGQRKRIVNKTLHRKLYIKENEGH